MNVTTSTVNVNSFITVPSKIFGSFNLLYELINKINNKYILIRRNVKEHLESRKRRRRDRFLFNRLCEQVRKTSTNPNYPFDLESMLQTIYSNKYNVKLTCTNIISIQDKGGGLERLFFFPSDHPLLQYLILFKGLQYCKAYKKELPISANTSKTRDLGYNVVLYERQQHEKECFGSNAQKIIELLRTQKNCRIWKDNDGIHIKIDSFSPKISFLKDHPFVTFLCNNNMIT